MEASLRVGPRAETALILAMPWGHAPRIDAVRARHDPTAAAGLPAHITVLYPFLPPGEFAGVMPRLESVVRRFPPLEVHLTRLDRFRGDATVVYLAPEEPEPIRRITRALTAAFPGYPLYGGRFGDAITPHLTLGYLSSPEEVHTVEAAAAANLPLRFRALAVTAMRCPTPADPAWSVLAQVPFRPGV